jgi:hypothetical protein
MSKDVIALIKTGEQIF